MNIELIKARFSPDAKISLGKLSGQIYVNNEVGIDSNGYVYVRERERLTAHLARRLGKSMRIAVEIAEMIEAEMEASDES